MLLCFNVVTKNIKQANYKITVSVLIYFIKTVFFLIYLYECFTVTPTHFKQFFHL